MRLCLSASALVPSAWITVRCLVPSARLAAQDVERTCVSAPTLLGGSAWAVLSHRVVTLFLGGILEGAADNVVITRNVAAHTHTYTYTHRSGGVVLRLPNGRMGQEGVTGQTTRVISSILR